MPGKAGNGSDPITLDNNAELSPASIIKVRVDAYHFGRRRLMMTESTATGRLIWINLFLFLQRNCKKSIMINTLEVQVNNRFETTGIRNFHIRISLSRKLPARQKRYGYIKHGVITIDIDSGNGIDFHDLLQPRLFFGHDRLPRIVTLCASISIFPHRSRQPRIG